MDFVNVTRSSNIHVSIHIQTKFYFNFVSVHLLSLNVAIEAFDAHGLRGQNERMLDVGDIVTILGSLYETISVSIYGDIETIKYPDDKRRVLTLYEVQISLLLKTQSLRIKFALISSQPGIRLKDIVSI